MKSLNEVLGLAIIRCLQTRMSVDVYKNGPGYNCKETNSRNSKLFERRVVYENGKAVVYDATGKVVNASKAKATKKAQENKSE